MNVRTIAGDIRRAIIKAKLKSAYNCRFGRNVFIDKDSIVNGYVDIQKNSRIRSCILERGTNIGRSNEYVGCHIGKFCITGDYNRNIYGHHPTTKYVAMHSFFYTPQKHGYAAEELYPSENLYTYADKDRRFYNIIGNDVYITNNVLILEGVKIGDGAIITPGTVVTKNVPAYAIVRGNPGKVVAYRFRADEIAFLKKLQWWNKSDEWLRAHVNDFSDIKKLMKSVIKETGWDSNEFEIKML